MKISDLQPRIIAIYAGRFHPFHYGHSMAYKELASKFGINNTYIASSGKVEPNKSPFSFDEKKVMMQATGISPDHIVEEKVPYSPVVLPQKLGLDPNTDVLVFGIGAKDMQSDPRFSFAPLKSGSPAYFQKYIEGKLKPFISDKGDATGRPGHGYVVQVNDYKFQIAGETAGSASEIRNRFATANEEGKIQIVKDMYPKTDDVTRSKILSIFIRKLG
jgi:hypothetical protein